MSNITCVYAECGAFYVMLVVKNPPAYTGGIRDLASIPGPRKIPWRRKWQPTPIFLPGKSHWQGTVHGVAKSRTWLKWLSTHACLPNGNNLRGESWWCRREREEGLLEKYPVGGQRVCDGGGREEMVLLEQGRFIHGSARERRACGPRCR